MFPSTPSLSFGSKYDSRTGFRIGSGVMVAQRDGKPTANIWQPCRVDAPLRTRKLDRTGERQSWHTNTEHGATRLKHAPIERGLYTKMPKNA